MVSIENNHLDFNSVLINNSQNHANKTFTENDAIIQENTAHSGLDVFTKTVRSSFVYKSGKHLSRKYDIGKKDIKLEYEPSANDVKKYYNNMINDAKNKLLESYIDGKQLMIDTWVLPIFKRTISRTLIDSYGDKTIYTGQGERTVSYQMFIELYQNFPMTSILLLNYYPKFGYWGDLFNIWHLIQERPYTTTLTYELKHMIYLKVLELCTQQLHQDIKDKEYNKQVSLLSKWIPSEKSTKGKECKIIINEKEINLYTALSICYSTFKEQGATSIEYMRNYIKSLLAKEYSFKTITMFKRNFRKTRSNLNNYLDIFEIKACDKRWSEVNLSKLPAKTMLKNKLALLNEDLDKLLNIYDEEKGNRYPEDMDRIKSRKNMLNLLLSDNNINVSTIEPHEILKSYILSKSSSQKELALKQWKYKIEEVFNEIVLNENLDIKNLDSLRSSCICSLIPMMDVSGSMNGIPMDVSIGLGLFIIALQKRFGLEQQIAISFSKKPIVFNFTNMTLYEQIKYTYDNTGLNTNFEEAIDLVLDAMKKSNTVRNLIVFTDGQFDNMNIYTNNNYIVNGNKNNTNWITCHQHILKKVANLGLNVAPNIIYWNLRDKTPGVQVSANHPGVQMLQGYSPNIIKFVLYNDELKNNAQELNVISDNGLHVNIKVSSKTSYDTYRQVLDQECFDVIRRIVYNSTEGCLANIVNNN